mmetsp:Transcript_56396/g.121933  ORF Transcript_56396/g.121933 Transcript_56396/m.121933 type:complete len:201 (+) Transcript_56396:181-783(+)
MVGAEPHARSHGGCVGGNPGLHLSRPELDALLEGLLARPLRAQGLCDRCYRDRQELTCCEALRQARGPLRLTGYDARRSPTSCLQSGEDPHQEPASTHAGDDGIGRLRKLSLKLPDQGGVPNPGRWLVEGMHVGTTQLIHQLSGVLVCFIPDASMHDNLSTVPMQLRIDPLRRGRRKHHGAGELEMPCSIGSCKPSIAAT